ncbi:NIPSNAP family protein [Planctomicrobium piriforme]|uniref:NIPSNAP protein n=1 Tax=Planctomicrobium piriforme TaxID=1576369 RepID=A0A1I3M537_9PLAN|nr:NIPSNAP family protein [Planctomicrobium piriforme]SFI92072.1 NIPSNAP protein [Planctomicrobium piriforme]
MMQNNLARVASVAVIVVSAWAVKGILLPQQSSAEGPLPVTVDDKSAQGNQFYELRIYTAAPGKMEALHQRFRDHTLRLFEKHGIKSIGYWTEADSQARLYYLVAYPDRASREKMLINGIAADPEFRQAVAESESNGKLTSQIESVLLTPTDYSALK